MNIRLPARIGAFACLGVAVAMAALALRDTPQSSGDPLPQPEIAAPADPLKARLLRCQQAGEAAGSDRECLTAWAENRRRFLGLGRARPAGPVLETTTNEMGTSAAPLAGPGPAFLPPEEH